MIEWPSDIPLPQFGVQYSANNPKRQTKMISGRTIERQIVTDVPTDFSARWILSTDEAQRFENFYQNDTVDGTEWIYTPLDMPGGRGNHFIKFRGGYTFSRVGQCVWQYTANMRMYMRPGGHRIFRITEDNKYRVLETGETFRILE